MSGSNWSKNPPDGAEIIEAAREIGLPISGDKPVFEFGHEGFHFQIWANGRVKAHEVQKPGIGLGMVINRIPQLVEGVYFTGRNNQQLSRAQREILACLCR